jgi:hypothetical protein
MDVELLKKHMDRLKPMFPNLKLTEKVNGMYSIIGNIGFTVKYDDKVIKDDYDIEITIPDAYPQFPPTVQETGNRILRQPDNHINDDGTFCFGAPLAVKHTFAQQRDLLWFVREQVVRFLFNHSYKRDYGIRPDGELSHGANGLLEFYYDLFGTRDNFTVLGFLRILSKEKYDEHDLCPCGSGRKIRKCHYRLVKKVRRLHKAEEFQYELVQIISYLSFTRDRFR